MCCARRASHSQVSVMTPSAAVPLTTPSSSECALILATRLSPISVFVVPRLNCPSPEAPLALAVKTLFPIWIVSSASVFA